MSTLFLAAAFRKRFILQGHRADLLRGGFTVTSRWIDLRAEEPAEAARCARDDLEDIALADIFVMFGDKPRTMLSRGGHHFEAGYALALNKRMILVEHRENIYAHLPAITFYETWAQALSGIMREEQRLRAA